MVKRRTCKQGRVAGWAYVAPAALLALACSSVADNDPSMWAPSHDLGGQSLAPNGAGGDFAAGGATSAGGSAGAAAGNGGTAGTAGNGGSAGTLPQFGTGGSAGTGTGGTGSGGTGSGGTGAGTNSGPCAFSVDFTTTSANGTYSPRNVLATWIAAPGNVFVKTLEMHASSRKVHLLGWNAAAHGNTVDAVTSATLANHGARHATWDCTDVNHKAVPDGPYRVYFEFTESDSAFLIFPKPKVGYADFTKGQPGNVTPADFPNFHGIHVTLQ